ncbi:MAG: hypothetical protein ACD_2C00117G0001 [uncultured bacterium (gcode 4)]|uniref:Uncharacterized protein n=1 Tax=uncultured bacterium (gcode 4) TaxID=1234023 RepID=K2FES5_9BACT|nr:MAG: hypothetical protein ACD_2C00117G0001 [uncultured bacterium (gcode 4)]
MLKVFTWSTYYFVPTPTLFWLNSWTWNVVYDNTFWSWKDLLPWVNNVAVFDSSKVYASTSSTWLSTTEVTALMVTIQSAYLTWNVTTPAVQAIVAASWAELINIWEGLVKNSLWGGINLSSSENSDPIQNLGSGWIISYYWGYTIHTFLTGWTFDMTWSWTVDVLVVAWGGWGGWIQGWGGWAWWLRYVSSLNVSAQSYMVTVGAGWVWSTARWIKWTNWGNSIFSTVTAIGWGWGWTENYPANSIWSDGGSWGWGSAWNTNANWGAGVAGQWNNWGIGKVVGTLYAGGGWGGWAGSTWVSADNSKWGDWGLWFNSSINWTNTFYAWGGWWGWDNRATTIFWWSGWNWWGWTGWAWELSSINGANWAPNTWGGWWGWAYVSSPITDWKWWNWGSWIVIIRYLTIN